MRHLSQFRPYRYVARYPFVFPGGYEQLLVMNDGGLLCSECVRDNYRDIVHDTRRGYRTGWDAAGVTLSSDLEGTAPCDHCGRELSPYVED